VVSRVALVRAPNPSAMTLTGTNSYVVDAGDGQAFVIDPGPIIERHIDALIENAASRNLKIAAIGLTHGHPDHVPGALPLVKRTGAIIYAHPNSEAHHDRAFELEGDFALGTMRMRVMDAPGHTFEHVIFHLPDERALFTGDVILGEGTVVIAPPGGAMRAYMNTLARLRNEFGDARTIYGGHGPPVADAQAKIAEYIAHRELRQRELLDVLRMSPSTIPELVARIYGETRRILWPAAARQMLAYLIALEEEGTVAAELLTRDLTPEETAILNPAWESIVGAEHAPVIEAELGAQVKLDKVYRYRLVNP
jgi:glyoxylase-like metal-dependent hydrolase (beta-lactamase superfamily II)